MANLSLSNLVLSHISSSPILSIPKQGSSSRYLIEKSMISHFSNNFIFSSFAQNLYFISTKFSAFLRSVIKIDSIVFLGQAFTGDSFKSNCEDIINITLCSFTKCIDPENGGAISLEKPSCNVPILRIQYTTFAFCSASKGGAIYAAVDSPKINFCCFSNCCASFSHHSVVIFSWSHYSSIFQTTLLACPAFSNSPHVLSYYNTICTMNSVNSSKHSIEAEGVFLTSSRSAGAYLRLSLIFNNTGVSGIFLSNTSYLSITMVHIINNKLDIPIALEDIDVEPRVMLVKTVMGRNKFPQQIVLSPKSIRMSLVIDNCMIDKTSLVAISNSAHSIDYQAGELREMTRLSFYQTNNCILTIKVDSTKSPFNQRLFVTVTAGVVISILIFGGITYLIVQNNKKKAEHEWILANDNKTDVQ